MEVKELKEKWEGLNPDNITGFRSLRMSGDCKPDIYIAIDEKGNRCLILRLPSGFRISFPPSVKENMSIELYPEKNLIVLKLLTNEYVDLFDDLILSLFNKVRAISSPDLYTKEFVRSYLKWSEFFSDQISETLSEETIKGLFGELAFLNTLISDADQLMINDILIAWRGPYDAVHDFVFASEEIEVKTKESNVPVINISSEFQLEIDDGKNLKLVVVNILRSTSGLTLKDLIVECKRLISERFGNSAILLKALLKKGLNFHNLYMYDDYKYNLQDISFYDCGKFEFPRIIRSKLDICIVDVAYSLQVNLLQPFIVNKKMF